MRVSLTHLTIYHYFTVNVIKHWKRISFGFCRSNPPFPSPSYPLFFSPFFSFFLRPSLLVVSHRRRCRRRRRCLWCCAYFGFRLKNLQRTLVVRSFFFLFFFKEGRLSMRMTTPAVFWYCLPLRKPWRTASMLLYSFFRTLSFFRFLPWTHRAKKNKKIRSQFKAVI